MFAALEHKMLTSSSNQYLRPEYLTPLPTTLDAKKSPLALLAQTCSQIGADPLPTGSSKSSLLNSSSSNHDGGSTLGGSSSTPLSSSSNPSSSGSTSSSSSSYKKSKSSHHLNVGTEHPPPTSKHRTSSGSGGSVDGKKSKSFKSSSSSSHQSSGNSDKSGSKEGRLTLPLVRNNSDSNCSSGSGSSSCRAKSASPTEQQDKRKTPLSTAGDKSPSVTTTADNKSVVGNNNNVDVGTGSISASTGNPIPVTGNSSTTANDGAAAADSVLSKVDISHPSFSSSSSSAATTAAPSAPQQAPIFSSAPLTNGSGLGGKLNLNGPLGDLTSAELFSLSSLKSHGAAALPFPPFYPGLAGLGAASAGGAPATTNLPPYLHSYARLKAAAAAAAAAASAANGGATDHMTANGTGGKPGGGHGHVNCRDPFCTSCQLGAGHLGASALPPGAKPPCPAGCLQCDHHSNPFTSTSFPFIPRLPLPPSFYSSALANSASSAAAAASANSAQPYVCNWIVGDTYCGKRFSSSDELLQHLRSHTSLSSAAASSQAQSSDHLLPYAHNPFLSLMSMNLGRSSYPSPAASLNHLSSGRYHPYSKLGSMTGLPSAPSALNGLGGGHPGGPAAEMAAAAAAGLLNFSNSPAGFPSLGHPQNPYFPYAAFYGPR